MNREESNNKAALQILRSGLVFFMIPISFLIGLLLSFIYPLIFIPGYELIGGHGLLGPFLLLNSAGLINIFVTIPISIFVILRMIAGGAVKKIILWWSVLILAIPFVVFLYTSAVV